MALDGKRLKIAVKNVFVLNLLLAIPKIFMQRKEKKEKGASVLWCQHGAAEFR